MSANSKKSIGGTFILIFLGIAALFAGTKWLALLIPVATLIWYSAGARLRSGRN